MKFLSKHTLQLVIVSSWGIIPNFFKLQIFMIRCSSHKCGLFFKRQAVSFRKGMFLFQWMYHKTPKEQFVHNYYIYICMSVCRYKELSITVMYTLPSLWGLQILPAFCKAACGVLCLQLTEVNRKGTKLHTFGGLNLASWDMFVNMKLVIFCNVGP